MKAKIRELMEQRANLVDTGRKLYKKVEDEGRVMTAEEKTNDEKRFTDIEEMSAHIARLQRQHELELQIAAQAGLRGEQDLDTGGGQRDLTAEQRAHLARLKPLVARGGVDGFFRLTADGQSVDVLDPRFKDRASLEFAQAFEDYLRTGVRKDILVRNALQADDNPAGGFLLAPMQTVSQLIKAVDDLLFMRQLATKFTVAGSDSLGAASLDTDPEDGTWSSEIATVDEDTAMAFGKRELKPNLCAKLIKVSMKLLARAGNAEGIVTARLAYKFGVTQEKGFLTGTGVNEPLGVFTASASGVPTTQDVNSGSTTNYTANGLIDTKYKLKAQYLRNARWLLPRTGIQKIAKLTDGVGQYLWQPSIQLGQPDMLSGHPVLMSEYVPNTFTNGNYIGMFADFSHYWIADAMNFSIQRLVELYAATSQVGFIGRLEADGQPVLAEAFARIKAAA